MMRQVIKVEIEQLALLERGSIGTLFTKIHLTMLPNSLDVLEGKVLQGQPFYNHFCHPAIRNHTLGSSHFRTMQRSI